MNPIYQGSFVGMTTEPVKLEALLETRERLLRGLPAVLDGNEREFLRTLVGARPDWSACHSLLTALASIRRDRPVT